MIHELRIYHCLPGRVSDVSHRFENLAMRYWKKYGIRPLGFWTVQIGSSNHDIYYLLEWQDLAERERVWNAFAADPDWTRERLESERDGPMISSIENLILAPTRYSGIGGEPAR